MNRFPGTAEVLCSVNYSTLASKPCVFFFSFVRKRENSTGDKAKFIARLSLREQNSAYLI